MQKLLAIEKQEIVQFQSGFSIIETIDIYQLIANYLLGKTVQELIFQEYEVLA